MTMRSPRRAGAARLDETGSERRDVPEVALLVIFPTVRFFAATFFGVVFLTVLFFAELFFAGTARLLEADGCTQTTSLARGRTA